MSAEVILASGNNASLQGTTMGGSKPLHRFMKGQPKIIGIVVLVLGSSFIIISFAIKPESSQPLRTVVQPGFFLGVMFILCGILYIVTEHKPTKKTVTISLALSIVTLLGTFWTILRVMPNIVLGPYHHSVEFLDDNFTEGVEEWSSHYENMGISIDTIYVFYSFVGAIIYIVMSVMAGAALRSTKSQAIVVMTTTATETPVE